MKKRTWQIKVESLLFNYNNYYEKNNDQTLFKWNQRQATKKYLYSDYFENQIKTQIQKGDKIVLWIHGDTIGIYALGEISEAPVSRPLSSSDSKYYLDKEYLDMNYHHLTINVTHNLFDNPISHEICHYYGITKYRSNFFGGLFSPWLNPKLPSKYNVFPRPFPEMLNIKYDFKDYYLGKLDTYGWIPIKPIDETTWEKITDMIKSKKWSAA